jgi:hypothetical protein
VTATVSSSPRRRTPLAGLGIATLAIVVLGLGLVFSIFDRFAILSP